MSKRLQVIMPDDEFDQLTRAARRRRKPVAEIVRESLRRTLGQDTAGDPDRKLAAVLRFARFNGPTGDIETVLEDIERGRDIA